MSFNKIALAVVCAAGMVSASAMAAKTDVQPTEGKIEFSGELVNSACGLAPSSSPVKVDFGQIPTSQLKDGQRAGEKQAKIELQYCDTTVAKTATVTYNPTTVDAGDSTLAAITSGTAKGAGIGLVDSGNKDVVWGRASSQVKLTDDTTEIPFVAYLKADNASGSVTPGDFQSTINFKIDYQ